MSTNAGEVTASDFKDSLRLTNIQSIKIPIGTGIFFPEKGEWALGMEVRDYWTIESYIAAAAYNSLPRGDILDTPLYSLWLIEATNSWNRTQFLLYENIFIANCEPRGELGLVAIQGHLDFHR